ncbi:MAG: SMI1/KNR4 family protein [Ruminococcus sp.]|uniref:SMI1/KNR4 family protein n=1 Tax=Ruminococcus sp. TaxID=41978 RepID=UPI0025D79F2C|nr:SMI1/KNR4 family protein [Ruminococcus sp.]MBO4866109.1 SMI1/KNR4 family protein [Ruminococcus sp.]
MDIIEAIRKKYGGNIKLCAPLDDERYEQAKKILPEELAELLRISNGILETMPHPKTGEIMDIYYIVDPFDDILSETERYRKVHGGEGVAFAGNGAGDSYVLKPDGKIFLMDYIDEEEEFCAENLTDFFEK